MKERRRDEMTLADVNAWLAEHKRIAFYFSTNDVLEIRPDLSEEQAWDVLYKCELDDDEGCPIFYHVEAIAERMYGEAPSDEHRGEDHDGLLGLVALDDEKFLQELQDMDDMDDEDIDDDCEDDNVAITYPEIGEPPHWFPIVVVEISERGDGLYWLDGQGDLSAPSDDFFWVALDSNASAEHNVELLRKVKEHRLEPRFAEAIEERIEWYEELIDDEDDAIRSELGHGDEEDDTEEMASDRASDDEKFLKELREMADE
jgi:hypothetical protein